jgi:hypothetical protein
MRLELRRGGALAAAARSRAIMTARRIYSNCNTETQY